MEDNMTTNLNLATAANRPVSQMLPIVGHAPMVKPKDREFTPVTTQEHRNGLESLLHELKEVKTLLEAHTVVATTDATGIITHVNEQFCALSGYSREELLGQNYRLVNSGYH